MFAVSPRPPEHVAYQFDGTQASLDALAAWIGAGGAAVERVDDRHWRCSNDTTRWPLDRVRGRGCDEVVVFARSAGTPGQIVAHYPDVAAMAVHWIRTDD